jgi:hypothetical protein
MMANHISKIDDRSEELKQAHATLAQASLKKLNEDYARIAIANNQPTPVPSSSPYQYSVELSYGGLFFVAIGLSFENTNVGFDGKGGGLAVGLGASWGTAFFNYDINQISSWGAKFEFNAYSVVTNLNLWGMSGENIGSIVAGGLGLGTFIVGGQGEFFTF